MKYYTLDTADAAIISENADIQIGDLESVAAEYNANYDFGVKISGWEKGDFGDCWVKFYRCPDMDENGQIQIDGILCDVKCPGTHPGGRAWWCSPVDDVFVPVYEVEE